MGVRHSRRISNLQELKVYRTDLHVHTVLSPCAEIEMIPPLIVETAIELGIQLIGITDHNASGNIAAVQKAAQGTNLIVLPGMEIQTREDVHVLCLFDTLLQIQNFQCLVDANLPAIKNKPDYFGQQLVVDELGDFISLEERLLITSTFLSIDEVWAEVDKLDGIIIPAHINRKVNGLIEILGFVPPEIPIPALEISKHITPNQAIELFPQIKQYPLIQSGDVHRLSDFLGSTYLTLEQPTIAEIRLAMKQEAGRSCKIIPYQEK